MRQTALRQTALRRRKDVVRIEGGSDEPPALFVLTLGATPGLAEPGGSA